MSTRETDGFTTPSCTAARVTDTIALHYKHWNCCIPVVPTNSSPREPNLKSVVDTHCQPGPHVLAGTDGQHLPSSHLSVSGSPRSLFLAASIDSAPVHPEIKGLHQLTVLADAKLNCTILSELLKLETIWLY